MQSLRAPPCSLCLTAPPTLLITGGLWPSSFSAHIVLHVLGLPPCQRPHGSEFFSQATLVQPCPSSQDYLLKLLQTPETPSQQSLRVAPVWPCLVPFLIVFVLVATPSNAHPYTCLCSQESLTAGSGDHMGKQGLNLGHSRTRQAPSSLCYCT